MMTMNDPNTITMMMNKRNCVGFGHQEAVKIFKEKDTGCYFPGSKNQDKLS